MHDPLPSLEIDAHRAVDLRRAAGDALDRLPYALRIVLENVLRHTGGEERDGHRQAILDWARTGTSPHEVEFQPERLLMHDTTCGPALVDIAGMRNALAEAGLDPRLLNPGLPVDVSVDHSIAVDRFGGPGALRHNMEREAARNAERFRLMKWAQGTLSNFRVHPPGTGILHSFNLEQLATVVSARDGWLFPDTLIGTDSHTPMVNGLGVLGWGVGGLEAEGVMFGLPVTMRIPDVIGVRLRGALPEGVLATDLALLVTHRLRAWGLGSQFVEFFGEGVGTLSVGERAVVANMAPEYGAQTAYFPVDARSLAYLRQTGRSEALVRRVEAYARATGLWHDPATVPRYSDVIEIDLGAVATRIAGPQRPQDLLEPKDAGRAVTALARTPGAAAGPIGTGAVAIAAITSCTNTTDPRLTVAAGLLARKARARGLRPKPWVKTSFSPGSPAAARYLQRAGLIDDLEAVGFGIVGFGCMTCIGNSGALLPEMEAAIRDEGVTAAAVLSGNRNFPGRVHPLLDAGFLASPPLVIAYALVGDVNLDILRDPLGQDAEGRDVRLADLWPSGEEIDRALTRGVEAGDFPAAFGEAQANRLWQGIEAPAGDLYPWEEQSTYLRRPPFTTGALGTKLGDYEADPILVLGDDVSTDQISPAGAVPGDSEAARYLIAAGEDPADLNVYSARRGNDRAMVRGLYTNASVRNLLAPGVSPGSGVDPETGEVLPLFALAERLAARGRSAVIVAGERYGQGSSRDWGAKGPALLGVRAVLAQSFERIHRTNLIGMGILPLRLPKGVGPEAMVLRPGDRLRIEADLGEVSVRGAVRVALRPRTGEETAFGTVAEVETGLELELLRQGGIVPFILSRARGQARRTADERSGRAAR
ncbi:MAG TPA: aconitate hydratase AcnA [Rubellimicrobium sp.]|nr:aconitate hydratase AcnA [Rubellimicrobium sp.]